MIEIEELPDCLRGPISVNIREVPQLKYVVEMSERLCPDAGFLDSGKFLLLGCVGIFLDRYFAGIIYTSFKV